MFEGTRLNYIVPGYTGHIPKASSHMNQSTYTEQRPVN